MVGFYTSSSSPTRGWNQHLPLEEERPNELQKDATVPAFSGLHVSELLLFMVYFQVSYGKIYINPLFLQLLVPVKVKTPGFKGQSWLLIALNSVFWLYGQDNATWGLARLAKETPGFSDALKFVFRKVFGWRERVLLKESRPFPCVSVPSIGCISFSATRPQQTQWGRVRTNLRLHVFPI